MKTSESFGEVPEKYSHTAIILLQTSYPDREFYRTFSRYDPVDRTPLWVIGSKNRANKEIRIFANGVLAALNKVR